MSKLAQAIDLLERLRALLVATVLNGKQLDTMNRALDLLHEHGQDDKCFADIRGLSHFDYECLIAWMTDPERKPANTAFTAGSARDAARAFEAYLAAMQEKFGSCQCKPHLQIGQFVLSRLDGQSVWIGLAGDGEGGQFRDTDLIPVLEKFYAEHF